MELIKTGIIGFGRWAERCHLKAMWDCGLYDIAGVCDITAARRAAAEDLGLEVTDSLDDFLTWDIDLMVVSTHTAAHYASALRCAQAGKHVLIDTPLAQSGPQAQEIVNAARQSDVVLTVFHNRHLDNDYRMVKAAVRNGLLGQIITVDNRLACLRPNVGVGAPEYNQAWRITSVAGGGTLLEAGPHLIEQVLDLLGTQRVVQVFADIRHVVWGDADDYFRIDLIFENGARAAVSKCDFAHFSPPDKWLAHGTAGTLHGPCGPDDSRHIVIHGDDWELRQTRMVEAVDLHVNLAEHIREGKPLVIPPQQALRVMQVIQAAIDSSKAGKSVDVII